MSMTTYQRTVLPFFPLCSRLWMWPRTIPPRASGFGGRPGADRQRNIRSGRGAEPLEERRHRDEQSTPQPAGGQLATTRRFIGGGSADAENESCLVDCKGSSRRDRGDVEDHVVIVRADVRSRHHATATSASMRSTRWRI